MDARLLYSQLGHEKFYSTALLLTNLRNQSEKRNLISRTKNLSLKNLTWNMSIDTRTTKSHSFNSLDNAIDENVCSK